MKTHLMAIGMLLTMSLAAQSPKPSKELRQLREWMVGSFSSAEQAAADSTFFDIRLEVVPIWQHRNDGIWLYVEQAAANMINKPYRQRIYQLTQQGERFISTIYTFPNPLQKAGNVALVEQLTPDSLTTRSGCEVILVKKGKAAFEGSTVAKNCPSELRGATYATSEALIQQDAMVTLDRGYNAQDVQVWGSARGGYIFKKK
jgi:hypothetical protein